MGWKDLLPSALVLGACSCSNVDSRATSTMPAPDAMSLDGAASSTDAAAPSVDAAPSKDAVSPTDSPSTGDGEAGAELVDIGMDYSFYDVQAAPACNSPGAIVKNYDGTSGGEDVRTLVKTQLTAMRASGLTTLRSFLWLIYDAVDNGDIDIHVPSGVMPSQTLTNLGNYLTDVESAGFGHIELTFGWQGDSHAYCNEGGGYGSCYNPARLSTNVDLINQTVSAVNALSLSKLTVSYDLANEIAPDKALPAQTITQGTTFILTVAKDYVDTFVSKTGVNNWTMSAPDASDAQRIGMLRAILIPAGYKPDHYEQHIYKDGTWLTDVLTGVEGYAKMDGIPFTLGEVPYDAPTMASGIGQFITANPRNSLAAVLQWPTVFGSSCGFNVPFPYTPGAYGSLR